MAAWPVNLDYPNYSEALIQHVIDMEDGCFSARAQNRTCLCHMNQRVYHLKFWICFFFASELKAYPLQDDMT